MVPTSVQDPPSQGLQNGRNVYLTSMVILSVLFLTGGETSVVPTHDWDPPSHGLPPCCDMGQNDTIGKIELNPLLSCQVIILIARMTFNCFTSCLMS